MSFWVKIGAVGALLAMAVAFHIIDKRNAVSKAVAAQRAIYDAQLQLEVNAALETSVSLLNSALKDLKDKDEQIQNINNRNAALINSLQQRPSRKDNPTASTNSRSCTGAELLREDGEFLAREAARADKILKERDYYYEQYRKARESLSTR